MTGRWRILIGVAWLLVAGCGSGASTEFRRQCIACCGDEGVHADSTSVRREGGGGNIPGENAGGAARAFERVFRGRILDADVGFSFYGGGDVGCCCDFGWSARMRDVAERVTRFRPLQTAVYWVQFIVVVSVLTFPLGMYEGYFREHKYGLLNQTFGPWMKDQLIGLTASVILGAVLVVPLFALVRRLGKSWWVWGAVVQRGFSGVRGADRSGVPVAAVQQIHHAAGCARSRIRF